MYLPGRGRFTWCTVSIAVYSHICTVQLAKAAKKSDKYLKRTGVYSVLLNINSLSSFYHKNVEVPIQVSTFVFNPECEWYKVYKLLANNILFNIGNSYSRMRDVYISYKKSILHALYTVVQLGRRLYQYNISLQVLTSNKPFFKLQVYIWTLK